MPHKTGKWDDHQKALALRSLKRVGPTKAIGYLPLYTIVEFLQVTPETLVAEAEARGLKTLKLSAQQCCIDSGALYVYDHDELASILHIAQEILLEHELPGDPRCFVQHIAAHWFQCDHPLYVVIAKAFGAHSGLT